MIKKLIERLNNIHEHFCFDGSSKAAKDIANTLLAQQVCIEQMRDALNNAFINSGASLSYTLADDEYGASLRKAIALQPDLSALREHDAAIREECAKICEEIFINGKTRDVRVTSMRCAEMIRKGEV
jgi:hypothetical protein